MTKYILIIKPDKRTRHHHYDGAHTTEVFIFDNDLALTTYIGNHNLKLDRMSVYEVSGNVSAQTFLTEFENKKRLALSKLTAEDQSILGIR